MVAKTRDEPGSARLSLDQVPSSAKRAREFVREHATLWECDDPHEIAALLTSEVVTNAVTYAAPPLALALWRRHDSVRVEVEDGSSKLPELRETGLDGTGGRGLLIVEALARCWGSDLRDPGKVVWFEYGPC